jgi:tetratricopeptide (TPR) repeat protein
MSKAKQKFDAAMAQFVGQNYDKSIHLCSEAIAFDPEFQLAFQSRGAAYLRLGNIQAALADFDRVLELDPKSARAFHLRGLAHEKAGDYTEAIADLSKAIEINPQYGAAYYSRANLFSKIGKTDQATEDIEMVTHLTEVNIETFADENNLWRSRHLQLESISNDDFTVER